MTEIERKIFDYVKANGEDDGVCIVFWLDESFNGVISIDGYTDILGIYNTQYLDGGDALSFYIASSDDSKETFVDFYEFPKDVQEKIIKHLGL